MATPNSKLIVDDLITALSAISVANGYKTNVADVTRYVQNWTEATTRPAIGLGKGLVTYQYQHGGVMRCTMTITLACHVLGATESLRLAAVEDILDDVIAAIHSDYTRDGNAVRTTILSSEDDLGIAHTPGHLGAGASLAVRIEVQWDRTTAAS